MTQQQKQYGSDEDTSEPIFKIPEVKSVLGGIDAYKAAVRQEHQELTEEEEKTGKGKQRQRPKGGTVCFCGNPSCGIGPFVERAG